MQALARTFFNIFAKTRLQWYPAGFLHAGQRKAENAAKAAVQKHERTSTFSACYVTYAVTHAAPSSQNSRKNVVIYWLELLSKPF